VNGLSVKFDRALIRCVHARDQVEHGRLPCSVGTDQAVEVASRERHIQIPHGHEAAKALRATLDIENHHDFTTAG
jgi:hypothetical protein